MARARINRPAKQLTGRGLQSPPGLFCLPELQVPVSLAEMLAARTLELGSRIHPSLPAGTPARTEGACPPCPPPRPVRDLSPRPGLPGCAGLPRRRRPLYDQAG